MTPEEERPILAQFLDDTRAKFADLGVAIRPIAAPATAA